MSKISILALCVFLLSSGISYSASSEANDLLKVGSLYQVTYSFDFRQTHQMDATSQYVIKIDAVSKQNSNWVLVEYPADSNASYTSNLAGKFWINLNYIQQLQAYVPPGQ